MKDWDPALQQTFGIFAGAKELGTGTLDGYALAYSTAGFLGIYSIQNEVWTLLTSKPMQFDASQLYRISYTFAPGGIGGIVYPGGGPNASGGISYTGPVNSSGFVGLFVRSDGAGAADATFDNFSIEPVPEPSTVALLSVASLLALVVGRRSSRRSKHAQDLKGGTKRKDAYVANG